MESPNQGPPLAAPTSDFEQAAQQMYRKNLQLAETNKTLLILRKIDEIVLGSVIDEASAMEKIANALTRDSGYQFVAIFERDQARGVLRPRASAMNIGDPAAQAAFQKAIASHPIPLRFDQSPMVRAIKKLTIVTESNLLTVMQPTMPIEDAENFQRKLGLKTFFICPLKSRNEILGTMVVGSSETPEELGFYQKSLLERLTSVVGVALDNSILYRRAEMSAKRLRTANRHLKELDKAKDEFVSMASHQLRTPLTSVKGYLSMTLEGDAGQINSQQHEFLDAAYLSAQRMVTLIADLLNVSRMTTGKFMINRSKVDVARMVGDEVQQLQRHAQDKQIELRYIPPKNTIQPIILDEDKTRQVVMNFVDNALYYTRKGTVTVTLQNHAHTIELRVKDTGIGVPKSAQKHLFTKFYRAENAQTIRPDGTGLGLYMAKRVIEDQGGTIIFETKEGKGSTFGFTLPIVKERI